MKYFVINLNNLANHMVSSKGKFKETTHVWRTLPFQELFLITSGELHLQHGEEKVLLKQGDIYITEKDTFFGGYAPSTCEFRWQHFTLDNYQVVELDTPPITTNKEEFYLPSKINIPNFEKLLLTFTQLDQLSLEKNNFEYKYIRDLIFTSLLVQISLAMHPQKDFSTTDKRFLSVVEYLNTHPTLNEFKSVKELSSSFGYNEKYFIRLFKKNMGLSPIQFITNRKIELAKGMLAGSDETVESIAITLGYDYQYFLKLFKGKTGFTPTKYRQSISPDYKKWKDLKL